MPRTETAGRLTPFQSSLNEALDTFETLRALEGDFALAVETVRECLGNGGKLLICGNGGSAADGAHIATLPFKVFQQMIRHPLTDRGIAQFKADWEAARAALAEARKG